MGRDVIRGAQSSQPKHDWAKPWKTPKMGCQPTNATTKQPHHNLQETKYVFAKHLTCTITSSMHSYNGEQSYPRYSETFAPLQVQVSQVSPEMEAIKWRRTSSTHARVLIFTRSTSAYSASTAGVIKVRKQHVGKQRRRR